MSERAEMECKRCGDNEDRIDGFCSNECKDKYSLEAALSKMSIRIAELEAAQRWIPVSERLPEFGTSILFYDSILERINKGTCTALDRDKTKLQWITDDGLYYLGNRCEYITHWMHLPTPPEERER